MNYLSHYLLDAAWISDGELLGTVLVDLARLRGKGFRLRAWQEEQHQVQSLEEVRKGILRHYKVDAWWHNSQIFHTLTHLMDESVTVPGQPELERGFFFAHIAAEMLLDRISMLADPVSIVTYYSIVERSATATPIADILRASGNSEWTDKVERELNAFLNARFLEGYTDSGRFVSTVFGLYERITGFVPPPAIVHHFEKGLPELEDQFWQVLKGSNLPWDR